MDPTERNCLEVLPLVGQMRGVLSLVFVFSNGLISSAKHQTEALRGRNSCNRVRDFEWENFTERVSIPIG